MRSTRALVRRIVSHEARVCVIGQGYVGLSVAAAAAIAGMRVDGVDLDADRVAALSEGRNVVPGVPDATVAMAYDTGRISFTVDMSVASEADVILICVPTPLIEHRPDLAPLLAAGRGVAPHLRAGSVVILESTTYPGTTEQELMPLLEAHGLRCGRDFLLAYSPERIDPGSAKYQLANTPRVVGGVTDESLSAAVAFYEQVIDDVVPVSSCRAAELAKLLENTFRMVNIALVNELATVCSAQGIDVWEVIRAASTKPFGFMPFYPGPGVGGHCIPLDPTYLSWQARRDTGKPFRIVELAQDINEQMPSYVADRVAAALNDHGKSVRGAKVLALGVTYKPDVGDVRESAALQVLEHLARRHADLTFHDPFVAEITVDGAKLRRRRVTRAALEQADCVLLLTPHASYDLDLITDAAPLLFDAQNATGAGNEPHVVTL